MMPPRPWRVAPLLAAVTIGPAGGQALPPVGGAAAVRAELAHRASVSVVAELARPEGAELTPRDVAAARERLARALAPHGVTSVRGLGDLPFVVLEVGEAQLAALLATGDVVRVAPQGAATID